MLLAAQAKEFQNFDLSRHQANTIYCSIAGVQHDPEHPLPGFMSIVEVLRKSCENDNRK